AQLQRPVDDAHAAPTQLPQYLVAGHDRKRVGRPRELVLEAVEKPRVGARLSGAVGRTGVEQLPPAPGLGVGVRPDEGRAAVRTAGQVRLQPAPRRLVEFAPREAGQLVAGRAAVAGPGGHGSFPPPSSRTSSWSIFCTLLRAT